MAIEIQPLMQDVDNFDNVNGAASVEYNMRADYRLEVTSAHFLGVATFRCATGKAVEDIHDHANITVSLCFVPALCRLEHFTIALQSRSSLSL